jgi:dipeptidyl aminopeptidase/acylaminoacyl peptidase
MDPNDFYGVAEKVDTWDDWMNGVQALARERVQLAETSLPTSPISAGEYYIEAGIYYHFAQLGYFGDQERKLASKRLSIDTYRLGLEFDVPPIRPIQIPYDGILMAAHLRLPAGDGPFPTVVLLPGVDSTKEEYHTFSGVLVKRGLATLAFEGPGQGETWFSRPMTEDYPAAFSAAIDYLEEIADVDSGRIGVYGRSMGGYLGPLCASTDHRVRALVSAGGIYEMSYWDRLAEGTRHNFRHAWGYSTMDEARERAFKMTLRDAIPRIECPFLIVHSGRDAAFPASGAQRMKDEATCEAELVMYMEGTHVCDNVRYKYQRFVADWLCRKL